MTIKASSTRTGALSGALSALSWSAIIVPRLTVGTVWGQDGTMSQVIEIRAVAIEHAGTWFVQGIEHDICTHAHSAGEVPLAFMKAVIENILINEELGRKGLEGIPPAPDEYGAMFDKAKAALSSVSEPIEAPASLLAVPHVDIRVAA